MSLAFAQSGAAPEGPGPAGPVFSVGTDFYRLLLFADSPPTAKVKSASGHAR